MLKQSRVLMGIPGNVLIIVAMLGFTSGAWGIDLKQAKSQGLVGESNTGYLDYVKSPPSQEVKSLVKDINKKRQKRFAETAGSSEWSEAEVAQRFYQKGVQATSAGNYYRDAAGVWVKK